MLARTFFKARFLMTTALFSTAFSSLAHAGIAAGTVIDFTPGTSGSANANAALGLPTSTDDGQTSPFNPPFHTTGAAADITIIGPGGHLTLQLSSTLHPTAGPDIGVFTNTGLGTASLNPVTAGTSTLGMHDTAIVSVSEDNNNDYLFLNNGNPIDLTMPSNAFTDGIMGATTVRVSGGARSADPFKPFTGSLSDYFGKTYPQMLTLLDGSFGGAWLDASSTGLANINYIRFDIPAGDRLVLDAVTAVPEPGSLLFIAAGAFTLLRRRR